VHAVTTPAAGVVRQHLDPDDRCIECGRTLAVYPNYPAGRMEWRCVNAACRLCFAPHAKPVGISSTYDRWSV